MINAEAEQGTLASRAGAAFERYRGGQSDAMADLVAMLTPILWHTVRAQRLDATSTEDVLQTTWLALVKNANSIADPRSVLQWLIVTAKRESWRVSRGQMRQRFRCCNPRQRLFRDASTCALWFASTMKRISCPSILNEAI